MKTLLPSLRLLAVLTLLTGGLYPLAVTGIARMAFADPMRRAPLLAQKTESPRHFWPRPSATDFATVASGASHHGPTSEALRKQVAERRARFGDDAPADLLTASGSGLDPHLSPAAARHQAARVAAARGVPIERVHAAIARLTESPQFGIFGEPRVNVLALNLALDAAQ